MCYGSSYFIEQDHKIMYHYGNLIRNIYQNAKGIVEKTVNIQFTE